MYTLKVVLEGTSAMLQNPMTEEQLDQLYFGAGARKSKDTRKPMEQLAAERVIRDADGHKGVPANYLFAALVEAGRYVVYDKMKKVSNGKSTVLPAFLSINEEFLPFLDQSVEHVMDKRRGRLDSGVAVCIVRPKFTKWAIAVSCEIDEAEISEDKIKSLFERAGRMVGLGDFRPSCKGQFGKFKIVKWEKMVQAKAA